MPEGRQTAGTFRFRIRNTKQWSLPLIEEAERHLADAFRPGHLQAAFNWKRRFNPSMRNARAAAGSEWTAIAIFYEQLIRISPTLGARTGYAAAIAEINGADAGLAALDAIAM